MNKINDVIIKVRMAQLEYLQQSMWAGRTKDEVCELGFNINKDDATRLSEEDWEYEMEYWANHESKAEAIERIYDTHRDQICINTLTRK